MHSASDKNIPVSGNAARSTLKDVRNLKLHYHRRVPHDGVTLISARLHELNVGFRHSPEIYHLHYDPQENHTGNTVRGGHAHRQKQEIFRSVFGKCMIMVSDGGEEKNFIIGDPEHALYVPSGIWHEVWFEQPAVLEVISSSAYHEKERLVDYITDYDHFRLWKMGKLK